MSNNKNGKSKTKSKKEDGAFPSKNINHNPQAESARAKFGKDSASKE
ncbi:MAG TPA: CPC_1213 family protein [Ruminiclostridium sp.]